MTGALIALDAAWIADPTNDGMLFVLADSTAYNNAWIHCVQRLWTFQTEVKGLDELGEVG